jgi:mono/diheme cytochrome c family protein
MSMVKLPTLALLLRDCATGSAACRRLTSSRQADLRSRHQSLGHKRAADGTNLPPGSGTAAQGAKVFGDHGCNQCHGDGGKGGSSNMLVGNPPLTKDGIASNKTIANFWAYPTTVFDYIRRAMPWPTPHTLTDDEVYAICAYLFAANKLIPPDEAMNAQTLPKVKMPNHDNFIIKFPDRI